MAGPVSYPGGLGGSGPAIAGYTNDLFSAASSGTVVWVDTNNGNDSNGGYEREKPKKTLASAYSNVLSFGTIVIEAGSHEELGSGQVLGKAGLRIVGLGSGTSRPRYTSTSSIDLFDFQALGTQIENLYFPASTGTTLSRVKIDALGCEIKDCYFENGANDTTSTGAVHVTTGGSYARVTGTTFLATGSQPATGLCVDDTLSHVVLDSCTFDGGSFGWSSYALNITAAAVGFVGLNLTFAGGADIGIISGASYQFYGLNLTKGRVVPNL